MAKRMVLVVLLLVAALAAYLLLWPVPVDPMAWDAPEAPALEGDYAVNSKLADIEHIDPGLGIGPEDVEFDSEGRVYTGYYDGRIIRWRPGLSSHEVFCDTGGRPLGLEFDADGNLICADADRGLVSISPDGELTVLTAEHGGVPFGFTDDCSIAPNGQIYFTDASHKFHKDDSIPDIIENRPNGRLLVYDPETDETELVMDGLHFGNGVAVHPSGDYLLVNETARYRTYKVWLTEDRRFESEVFKENLPGFPDNVRWDSERQVFWIALPSTRNETLDSTAGSPWLRKLIVRLPAFVQPKAEQYAFALGVSPEGEVVYNLQDPDGGYAPITSVVPHEDWLFFGSIEEDAIGRMEAPE